jgi:GT2 family glycosyltransferase
MSNETVSVIIVTTGKEGYFKQCLESLRIQSCPAAEIIMIDNSCGKLSDHGGSACAGIADIKVYTQGSNMSYCQSLNRGIGISKGDFILCLNDDVVLDKRFIEEAVKGFSMGPRVGMVSGKILRFDRKTLDSTGLFLTVFRTARERGYGRPDPAGPEKEEYVFGVSGAVAFYRRKMLEELKIDSEYFDNDFGFFYEDLDIAWRGNNAGWRGCYLPHAIAYHLRGGTARKGSGQGRRFARRYLSDRLSFDLLKNRYLTIIKNDSLCGLLLCLPFIVFYDIANWGFIVLFRRQLLKMIFSEGIPFASALRKRRILKK